MVNRWAGYMLLAGLAAIVPSAAQAQNTTFGTAVHLLVGQTPIRVTLTAAAPDHFYDAPVVAGRSYCAEASASETELNPADPVLTLLRQDQATSLGPDISLMEPKGAQTARVCFIAPATETAFIKLSPAPGFENREYTMRFLETTLFANWAFIGGDYLSFTLLRNTTNSQLSLNLTWRDTAGNIVGTRTAQSIAPNGLYFIEARSVLCPNPCTGQTSVEVAHAGSPEAIVGSQTTLSGATGLSFDTLTFQRRTW